MQRTLMLVLLCCPALLGCVPGPIVYTMHVQAHVTDVEQRVVSIQMLSPHMSHSERVISYGVFTAALLEASNDTQEDFVAGRVMPDDVRQGRVRLYVQESGRSCLLRLPPRAVRYHTLYVVLDVPPDVEDAQARWDPDAEQRHYDAEERRYEAERRRQSGRGFGVAARGGMWAARGCIGPPTG